MAKLKQQMRLPDGRQLAWDEHGEPEGTPLLYFHGTPSARVEWNLFGSEALARKHNLRVIVPDRPGSGLSDFQPGRRFSDYPADVVALADHLGLDRFAILGYSGGGPFALACALEIPERLTRVATVSGTGPFVEPALTEAINPGTAQFGKLATGRPWAARLMLRMMGFMSRYMPERMIAQARASLPPEDQAMLARPAIRDGFLAMVLEALRKGPRGAQYEMALMVGPWEFRPQEIKMPVMMWHGEADQNAPLAMGRYMAEAIPNSDARFIPGEGHISLFANHADEILGSFAE
jgi:pimeloyl-ACP methyl ester carboxylesterase